MPDSIYLLQGKRNLLGASTCTASTDCTDILTCQYIITVQALFSDDRFFSPPAAGQDPDAAVAGTNGVYFAEGTASELGYYWCAANQALASLVYGPSKCQGGASGFLSPSSVQMPDFRLQDPAAGRLVVSARVLGLWTATLMACLAVGGVEACVPMDFLISVDAQPSRLNARPPFADYSRPRPAAGGVAPVTNRSAPVHVLCGTPKWVAPAGQGAGTALLEAFTEYDQWPAGAASCQGGQAVSWIEQANTLPYGVQVAARAVPLGDAPATSYLAVQWTPMCENPSHIGLFLFCFRASDRLQGAGAGLVPFTSLPSAPPENPLAAPCEYVRVDGPTFPPNPDMTLQLCLQDGPGAPATCSAYPVPQCSGDCCHCCSEPGCPCEAAGRESNCCAAIYAPLQKRASMVFRAGLADPSYLFSGLSFDFQYAAADFLAGFLPANRSDPPCFDTAAACPACSAPAEAGACAPPAAPYTASGLGYLVWDLRQVAAFSVDQQRSLAQAKRVCARVVKAVPAAVNQSLWARFYPGGGNGTADGAAGGGGGGGALRGFEPSCSYCFALRGAGIPFFVAADPLTQPNGTEAAADLEFEVGAERAVFLMGASAINPSPRILLEGALPSGAALGRQAQARNPPPS